jgi:hypothetical protein
MADIDDFAVSQCEACKQFAMWAGDKLIYPAAKGAAPPPSPDMPEDVRAEYLEASEVFDKSARAAGGLLRLGFEKLLKHVGATEDNPNAAIGELVKKGLVLGPLQQAMDSLRIFSNQAVHNGFVKLADQPETVMFLFRLMNYIVEQLITRPKEIEAIYASLPPDKLAGIKKRDGA